MATCDASTPGSLPPKDSGQPPGRPAAGPRRRCPTCRAVRLGEETCHRCGSDLRLLIAIEAKAQALYRAACRAYQSGFYRTAASRAASSARLEASKESLRLLAISSVRAGDYRRGVTVARRLLSPRANSGESGR